MRRWTVDIEPRSASGLCGRCQVGLDNLHRMACAVEDNWCAAWASLRDVDAAPGSRVDVTPDYVRVYTPGVSELLLNIVLRYAAPGPVLSADVERVIAPFRQYHLPFQWWLTLGTEPAGLREQLRMLGMQSWGGATSMALSLSDWTPRYRSLLPDVWLERVATAPAARDALRVICDVFFVPAAPMARWTVDNPAFQVYVAYWNGRAVAALATLRQEAVVGVYHVATAPFARRRGIAGNLLLLALHDAQNAGCIQATLTATAEARHLYEQLGFRACGMMEQWVPGHELSTTLARGERGTGLRGLFWDGK